jgi:hypothetical protein
LLSLKGGFKCKLILRWYTMLTPFYLCDINDTLEFLNTVQSRPEVGRVTLKSNSDETLSDVFILKVMATKR